MLAQTHSEIELIVVDYESTDDTDRIVADYPQATYLRRANRGVGVARNDGLAASVGDYRSGLRTAQSYWGSHLANETITLLAAGSFQSAARNLLTLARWHPAGLLELLAHMARRASLRLRRL